MIIVRGQPSRLMQMPIDGGGTDVQEGAVVMPGVTDDSNTSVVIVASGAAADAIGLLGRLHTAGAANDADPDAGLISQVKETGGSARPVAPFLPGCEVAAEYDQASASLVSVASATSTVITITSSEDSIDGSWVFVVSGTGAGQLEYVKAAASGSVTVKSAMTTTLDSTSKLIILRRRLHQRQELNTAATKLKSTAAAGNLTWVILRNEIKYNGLEGWIEPDPLYHHDLQVGSSNGFAARSILSPRDTLFNPGS